MRLLASTLRPSTSRYAVKLRTIEIDSQYGIQVVTRQFHQTDAAGGFLGILLAILTLVIPHYFVSISQSTYVHRHFRRFCADYGMPITVIATTGLAYWGRFNPYAHEEGMTLPTSGAFTPANGRSWLVEFWLLEGKWVGVAMPFGIVLFVLFYFDANVSVRLSLPCKL